VFKTVSVNGVVMLKSMTVVNVVVLAHKSVAPHFIPLVIIWKLDQLVVFKAVEVGGRMNSHIPTGDTLNLIVQGLLDPLIIMVLLTNVL
jgi:hypothetical protein